MKMINAQVEEITPTIYDKRGIMRHIEQCGRVCYKSEDKITNTSYKEFVNRLKENGHLSVLEHGTVYLYLKTSYGSKDELHNYDRFENIERIFSRNPYGRINTKITRVDGGSQNTIFELWATTNYRWILDSHFEFLFDYMCQPMEQHPRRRSFRVTCNIATSREFNRHRCLTISEQSTRYCNYSKDKFDGEVQFVKPHWYKEATEAERYTWEAAMSVAEQGYLHMTRDEGRAAQIARDLLPLSTKTEVIYTGFQDDWKNIMKQRSSKAKATGQHPDANNIANCIHTLLRREAQPYAPIIVK